MQGPRRGLKREEFDDGADPVWRANRDGPGPGPPPF